MTVEYDAAFPRHILRPSDACSFVPHKTEGAGKAGCPSHPQPRMQNEKAYECSHREDAEIIRPSLRNGFNGFLRALPGDRAFLPPSQAEDFFREA